MHSSRMCTVRCSGHRGGGGCLPGGGGVCLVRGSAYGGVCPEGASAQQASGGYLPKGCLPRGVYTPLDPGGRTPSLDPETDTPRYRGKHPLPPVDRILDTRP